MADMSKATLEDGKATTTEIERAFSRSGEDLGIDEKEIKRTRHRIDWRLIPALGGMYGMALMDRNNLPNAAIAGMLVDLDLLHGVSYNIMNLSFFITYVALQPLMILICRKVGPRSFLPLACLLWGCIVIAFGFAPNWPTTVPLRLLLGVLEAGYFPGALYLISTWYTRYEVARRNALFYFIGSFASALSGIIAYGLMQLDGVQGIAGWRWIFILEGVITVAISMLSAIFLVKFPDEEKKRPSIKFLSPEKLQIQIDRLNADRGDAEAEAFTWKRFLGPAKDLYIFGFPIILFLVSTAAYGMAFTGTIIARDKLGFSVAMAQCIGAPPYVWSGIFMYLVARYSDKKKTRGPILAALCTGSIVGISIMGFVDHPWVAYFGLVLTVIFVNSTMPAVFSYQATNIRGQWRRAFCSAALTGIGGIGGVAGALIFRTEDGPKFVPGFVACIVCNVLAIVMVGILTLYFRKKNRQADRGECVLLEDPSFRFTI